MKYFAKERMKKVGFALFGLCFLSTASYSSEDECLVKGEEGGVPGTHEYLRKNALPMVETTVGKIRESVYHIFWKQWWEKAKPSDKDLKPAPSPQASQAPQKEVKKEKVVVNPLPPVQEIEKPSEQEPLKSVTPPVTPTIQEEKEEEKPVGTSSPASNNPPVVVEAPQQSFLRRLFSFLFGWMNPYRYFSKSSSTPRSGPEA